MCGDDDDEEELKNRRCWHDLTRGGEVEAQRGAPNRPFMQKYVEDVFSAAAALLSFVKVELLRC